MNKYLLFEWILNDLEKNLENYYPAKTIENLKLEDVLFELNNRKLVDLPLSLPQTPEEMIPILREHFKDDVTRISLLLNHHFPDQYFFYRVSKLEPEIFLGFQFFSDVIPDFDFSFDKVGTKSFTRYLELNEQLMQFAHKAWPDSKHPQRHLAFLLYQGLGDLFLEKSDYHRYWLVATREQYFEHLDSEEKELDWSGRKEMQPGDLAFVYRTAPRKAITDILKVKHNPIFDPWGAWDGFWVMLEKVCAIEDIPIAKMREDETLKQWGLLKRNFVGTVSEPIPHSIYNALLSSRTYANERKICEIS